MGNNNWTSQTIRSSQNDHSNNSNNNHIHGNKNHRPGETRPYDYYRQDLSHYNEQKTDYPPQHNQQQSQQQSQSQYQHNIWRPRELEMNTSNDNYDRYHFPHHNSNNNDDDHHRQRYFRHYNNKGRGRTERGDEYKYGYEYNNSGNSNGGGGEGDSAVEASAIVPNNDQKYYSRDKNNDRGGREKRRRGKQYEFELEQNNGDNVKDKDSPMVAAALQNGEQRNNSCDHNNDRGREKIRQGDQYAYEYEYAYEHEDEYEYEH